MTLFIIFLVVFFITNLYENYFREREHNLRLHDANKQADKCGELWHWFQWFNWLSVVLFATVQIFGLYLAIRITLFIGSCWWILFDGGLNSLKKRYFFYQSKYTTSEFEQFGNPVAKIILFVVTFLAVVLL